MTSKCVESFAVFTYNVTFQNYTKVTRFFIGALAEVVGQWPPRAEFVSILLFWFMFIQLLINISAAPVFFKPHT